MEVRRRPKHVVPAEKEVLLRLHRLVQRSGVVAQVSQELVVGDLVMDLDAHEVTRGGDAIALTATQFQLLQYLMERPGVVVGKRELLTEVWRQPPSGADKTVDVHLSWLRRKLGETAASPRYLHTVRGVGVKVAAVEA